MSTLTSVRYGVVPGGGRRAPPDDTLAEDVDLHVSIARVVLLTED